MKALLLLLALGLPVQACLNNYVPNLKGRQESRALLASIQSQDLAEPWTVREERLRKLSDPTLETRNDLAVAMLHNGKVKEALPIFEQIEKESPGRYQTATNLGTALELAGENEKALWWIEEGIRRNQKSHDGSEWIHVALLQKKIEFARVGLPKEVDSILGIDDDLTKMPTGNSGETLTAEAVASGLSHQLHERLPFVPAPDYYVAALLFDLGRLHQKIKGDAAASFDIYKLSAEYAKQLGDSNIEVALSNARIRGKIPPVRGVRRAENAQTFAMICLSLMVPLIIIAAVRHQGNLQACRRAQLKAAAGSFAVALTWFFAVVIGNWTPGDEVLLAILAGALVVSILIFYAAGRKARAAGDPALKTDFQRST